MVVPGVDANRLIYVTFARYAEMLLRPAHEEISTLRRTLYPDATNISEEVNWEKALYWQEFEVGANKIKLVYNLKIKAVETHQTIRSA